MIAVGVVSWVLCRGCCVVGGPGQVLEEDIHCVTQ